MDARAIIAKVRQSDPPTKDELSWFARGLANGKVTDAQAGAFAMAVCLNGLKGDGRAWLTQAMRDSGDILEWDLPGPVVDKHSTGGIGDVVSLLLAPMLAAEGLFVPMISGRGLGHTGGTLDKLEAIPGVQTEISKDRFRSIVRDVGCAIVAANKGLAPADKRLYGVRDVTATVESIDLITASILSKKLAAGLDALVLDVKVGSGAFMADANAATALAEALVHTGKAAGCKTAALLTDMDEPLALAAGNAVEVGVVIDVLTGAATHDRLVGVTTALAARLSGLAGKEKPAAHFETVIKSGRAAEVFGRMIAALGGPADVLEKGRKGLPRSEFVREIAATEAGFVQSVNARVLGEAVVQLGAGRLKEGDRIDPSVGLSGLLQTGAKVTVGTPLAVVYAKSEAAAKVAAEQVTEAFAIGPSAPDPKDLVLGSVE